MPRVLLRLRWRAQVVTAAMVAAAVSGLLTAPGAAALVDRDRATPSPTPAATPTVPPDSAEDLSPAPTTDLSIQPFATATGDPGASGGVTAARNRVVQPRSATLPDTGGTTAGTVSVALVLLGVGVGVVTADRLIAPRDRRRR